jgi:hypothetical protein
LGLIFVAIGTLLVFFPGLTRAVLPFGLQGPRRQGFVWSYLIFSLMWTMGALAVTLGDYIGARNALASGDVAVIEGVATDFRPMPYEGQANESFKVSGKEVCAQGSRSGCGRQIASRSRWTCRRTRRCRWTFKSRRTSRGSGAAISARSSTANPIF